MPRLSRPMTVALVLTLVVATAVVGAVVVANVLAPDPDEVCEGIPREMGGCDPDQPTYAGATCAEVGQEFGAQLDQRGLAVIDGPASRDGESRAVRLNETVILVLGRANQYLRDTGLIHSCGVDGFIAAAETRFSEPFKARVGDYLYDDTSRPYAEWLEELRRIARVVDMDEDQPFLPTASAR